MTKLTKMLDSLGRGVILLKIVSLADFGKIKLLPKRRCKKI